MKYVLALLFLIAVALAACTQPKPDLIIRPAEVPVSIDPDNTQIVHVLVPCATLTPFTSYQDFMPAGLAVGGKNGTFITAPGVIVGTPGPNQNQGVLPPAEATLVFDNSEGCK